MTFTKYLYEAVLCRRTIGDSFNLSKQSVEFISSSPKRDFAKFKLLPEADKNKQQLFKAKELRVGQLRDLSHLTARPPPNNLAMTIQPFVGRTFVLTRPRSSSRPRRG